MITLAALGSLVVCAAFDVWLARRVGLSAGWQAFGALFAGATGFFGSIFWTLFCAGDYIERRSHHHAMVVTATEHPPTPVDLAA